MYYHLLPFDQITFGFSAEQINNSSIITGHLEKKPLFSNTNNRSICMHLYNTDSDRDVLV